VVGLGCVIFYLKFDQGDKCFKWGILASGHQIWSDNASKKQLLALNEGGLNERDFP